MEVAKLRIGSLANLTRLFFVDYEDYGVLTDGAQQAFLWWLSGSGGGFQPLMRQLHTQAYGEPAREHNRGANFKNLE